MSNPRKIRCIVDSVIDHGDRVYSLGLKPERPVPAFCPGQFLHLALDDYDPSGFWPESRVFSIASSPKDRNMLAVTYSVKGQFTGRMEEELSAGRAVWVKLPYGEFVVNGQTDAVLIAGGTGITAFQAFIEGLSCDHPHKVILLYGARRPELLLWRAATEAKREQVRQLQAMYFSEAQGGEGVIPGRLSLALLKDCGVSEGAVYYLAGPPSMVVALRQALLQQGLPVQNIRVDAWE